MYPDNRPIGVFDSGVGGISVLAELLRLMPNENYIYYGDSHNAPYGVRPCDEVKALTIATADKLLSMGCKCLVIACNTATSAAVRPLRAAHPDIPVIGIEPALKPAVLNKRNGYVLVLATAVTLAEDKFKRLMAQYDHQARIHTLACPGIVEFVEKGITEGPELTSYLTDLFKDYLDTPPDCVVLGCTHYPFVGECIKTIFGSNTQIFDGGEGTARETRHQLTINDICNDSTAQGSVQIFNSDADYIRIAEKLLKIRQGR